MVFNPWAVVRVVQSGIDGLRIANKVRGALSEPDPQGNTLVDKAKNLATGVPEIVKAVGGIARGEPRPVRVSAEDLNRVYRTNKLAAKTTYEGRIALINGKIASVSESRRRYDVNLDEGVVCRVNKSHVTPTVISELRKSQSVVVLGMIKGKRLFSHAVKVEHCSLAK